MANPNFKLDLLLHPVRARIVQVFIGGAQHSVQEVGERLPDVPQASLYRHLKALVDAEILTNVGERGLEKIYALPAGAQEVEPDELRSLAPAEHMRYFTAFLGGLLGTFGRYLGRKQIDLERDLVGYRQVTLNLSDAELLSLIADLNARMQRELPNEPTPERRPRQISRIVLPEEGPRVDDEDRPQPAATHEGKSE